MCAFQGGDSNTGSKFMIRYRFSGICFGDMAGTGKLYAAMLEKYDGTRGSCLSARDLGKNHVKSLRKRGLFSNFKEKSASNVTI